MELYILRHAIAEDRGSSNYRHDSLRPLTERGIARMNRGARGMARLGISFDLILTSPYVRARQTAETVAAILRPPSDLLLFPPLAADVPALETVTALSRRTASLNSVLLVGHEPQLSRIGSILLAGDTVLSLRLKKGGMFKLTCEGLYPGSATLDWWLMPKHLRQLAG